MSASRAAIRRFLEPHGLTPQQREVAALMLQGQSAGETAGALGISPSTARVQRIAIYRHFGVTSHPKLMARLLLPLVSH